jgi:hypothetical protein
VKIVGIRRGGVNLTLLELFDSVSELSLNIACDNHENCVTNSKEKFDLPVLDFLRVDVNALFNVILGSSLGRRLPEKLGIVVLLLLLERVVLISSLFMSGKKSSSVIGFIFRCIDSL